MVCAGNVLGYIGFDSVGEEKIWAEEITALLKIVGEIFANTLERKRTEEALRESERQYRTLFDSAGDAILVSSKGGGNFLDVNRVACNLLGYSKEEFLQMTPKDVVSQERLRYLAELTEEISHRGYALKESVFMTREGKTIPIELNIRAFRYGGREAMLSIVRDLTERKRLETQVQQAHKLEAIGTLAGGIAHDFNNLLMGIQGNASLMLLDIDSSDPHFEKLKNIEQYVKSGADLSGQLLGFARGGKYEVKPIDMNELIKKNLRMFSRTKKEITIHTKYQKDLWSIEVDRSQIDQVLLNLYVNAWQSMPGGGELYLETKNVILTKDYIEPYQLDPGRYVKISVTDTGVGMDQMTKERIFDPFFTTKEMGRGTGLGLASAYGIIKNHEGIINAYSEIGEGTTFNIYLPASEKEVVSDEELTENILRGTETILLVDDEDMIINVGKKIMEELGYQVLIAGGGKEAVEVYEENRDKIDMIVLDMIMPDMGGGDTYDRIREMNPDIKVLLSSGYSLNGQAKEILERGCNGFIQKPFNLRDLSLKLREILEK